MPPFTIKSISPQEKIKTRVMELFETVDDLKKLFYSILPKNSLLNSILKMDEKHKKEEVCDILLTYLGDNFFVYVSKVKSDSDDEKINPLHIIREKFLEQYCIYNKDKDNKVRQDIIKEFNANNNSSNKVTTLKELSKHASFLKKPWATHLCNKILNLPDIIVERPETEPQLPETIQLRQKKHLPRLYDFQIEGLTKIHNILNNAEDMDGFEKRVLINIPTGAGKTRMTVQAIIEWLNLREQGKSENAHEQQRNENGLIFWLASTNELCTQASDSFKDLFEHLGTAGQINLTNWYGANRRDLRNIREDRPGTHIVITNIIHTNEKFKIYENKADGTYKYDWYKNSPELEEIRKNTIAIVIDEAHEVTGEGYQDFLASMGFDINSHKRGKPKKIYNTQNIVLIGLSATPYRGSGIATWYKCQRCSEIFKNKVASDNHTRKNHSHTTKQIKPIDEDEILDENARNPSYFANLNLATKKIHRTFGRIFVPIPNKFIQDSPPTAILDVPRIGHIGDSIKISGRSSYDQYSELKFYWEISTFKKIIYTSKITPEKETDYQEFYHKFTEDGEYSIKLRVTNAKNISSYIVDMIKILPNVKSKIKGTGDLADSKEFYDILTNDQKILCKITHGVIDFDFGTAQRNLTPNEYIKWRMGTLDTGNGKISTDVTYNTKICEVINKCIKNHGKKRVLVFANSVKHSQELMIIFRVMYGYQNAQSVDGETNPGIRRKIVKDFREGRIPILCNYGVLTTGFDVPKIDTVVICRDVGSNALYTQMIGRGQRGPKAGGTEELWLITSNFPHQTETESDLDLELGWEALAENWQKFPTDIKKDLGVIDFEYRSNSGTSAPKLRIDDFILNMQPIEDLKLKCQTCGVVTEGLQNNLKTYGYGEDNILAIEFKEIIISKLKNNSFVKNCKFCQSILKDFTEPNCGFTKYITKNHKFDPIFLLIINYAYKYQTNDKFVVSWKILKNDLKNKTGILDDCYFTQDMPAMLKLIQDGMITIKNNLDVEFIKINNMVAFEFIINELEKNIEVKIKLQKIIDDYKNNPRSPVDIPVDDLNIHYNKLKNTLGRIPLEREFTNFEEKLRTQFSELFNGDYNKFLKSVGDIIKDDQNLKDLLYDQYFQLCIKKKDKITVQELNENGNYNFDDYDFIWTSFDKFEKKVEPVLVKVLEYYEKNLHDRNSEFQVIIKDIQKLKNIRPASYYHFEEIRDHSSIDIFRYVIQIKFFHLKFLQNYDGKNHGVFLQLVSDFFRLKEWIGTTPQLDDFIKLTIPLTTSNLNSEFGIEDSNYNTFLEKISVDSPILFSLEDKEKMRKEIMAELKKYSDKQGKENTLLLINVPLDKNDRLSVQIQMYFPDKNELTNLLFPVS